MEKQENKSKATKTVRSARPRVASAARSKSRARSKTNQTEVAPTTTSYATPVTTATASTAPIPETLRLLSAPDQAGWWIRKVPTGCLYSMYLSGETLKHYKKPVRGHAWIGPLPASWLKDKK